MWGEAIKPWYTSCREVIMENIQSVLIYETEDSTVVSEVLVMNETLWTVSYTHLTLPTN